MKKLILALILVFVFLMPTVLGKDPCYNVEPGVEGCAGGASGVGDVCIKDGMRGKCYYINEFENYCGCAPDDLPVSGCMAEKTEGSPTTITITLTDDQGNVIGTQQVTLNPGSTTFTLTYTSGGSCTLEQQPGGETTTVTGDTGDSSEPGDQSQINVDNPGTVDPGTTINFEFDGIPGSFFTPGSVSGPEAATAISADIPVSALGDPSGFVATLDMIQGIESGGPEFNNIAGVVAILVIVAVAFLLLKKKQ